MTPGAVQFGAAKVGAHNQDALEDWGFSPEDIAKLESTGAL